MAERRLDRALMEIVRKAWASILQSYKSDPQSGENHFTDNEGDVGFLKDVDALNALVEPFLLAHSSFVDPPIKIEDLSAHLEKLLSHIQPKSQDDSVPGYRGFSAAPYPYIQAELDYVDSASAVLRLICNSADLFAVQKKPIPKSLEKLLSMVSCVAVDFLLEAVIEDRQDARWPGFIKKAERPETYANLFFTNAASLALLRSSETAGVKNWIGPDRRDRIDSLLSKVAAWVARQFDPAKNAFWLDENRALMQPVGILYALEIFYSVADQKDEVRAYCAGALSSVTSQMSDLVSASRLQRDFFHTLPLPTGPGVIFYDDRRYIGAFLSLFATAKLKDRNVVDSAFIRAGDVLFQGVSDDWIDDATMLWDDGRPLIGFSQDALIGLVKYGLEGRVDMVSMPETDLRFAIRDALKSEEVIDVIFGELLETIRLRRDQQAIEKLKQV